MAVFTPVSLEQLSDWIQQFPLGRATSIRGISSGIENSNFFIGTERGEYVLTLFEKLHIEQLPFYLELMRHLAQRGIPVPAPVPSHSGAIANLLNDKPAAIVSKLEGESQLDPQPVHCAALGDMLARMHLAGRDFKIMQPNLRGLAWWLENTPSVLPFLPPELARLLTDEVQYQQDFAGTETYRALPRGPVHADLFRNNAMFVGERLSGIFDFYFAGCDTWLFDLAVTVNDWCVELDTGVLDQARAEAMLDAYRAVRPFTDAESQAWQPMLRAAALRFWLSRLVDFYMPREAEMLTPHDPAHFERILRLRIAHAPAAL
ncbi:homoserine kinase [Herbaspirillum sp. YR522]|uniref:homoserine kinase n=1 Tax=Herbaspirillum sp. YR522 TaxID=1144342 RepID=UPI00026F9A15|nr:homoserine kinase [Herbaspirillum sp. YR522]EJN00896.1 homoserine kinase, Neisseria type [Herbaspirillum sp. YR522]